MFYLSKLFDLFKRNPVKIGTFSILLTLTFLISGQKEIIQKKINQSLEKEEDYSYFFALISSKKNAQRVRRKLVQLPGVQSVKFISKDQVQKRVKKILGEIDIDNSDPLINYDGLKISLANELPPRGSKLIRDYLRRFVGEGIVLSSLQGVKKEKKEAYFNEILRGWGWEIVLISFSVISFLNFLLLAFTLRKDFYLLEEFTRKSFIGGKVYCLAIAVFFGVSIILLSQLNSVFWMGPLIVFTLIQALNLINFFNTQWE